MSGIKSKCIDDADAIVSSSQDIDCRQIDSTSSSLIFEPSSTVHSSDSGDESISASIGPRSSSVQSSDSGDEAASRSTPKGQELMAVFQMHEEAVRYGRVPKRSRELNSTPSSTDDPNIRVSTPGTPNTPQTPQMCSVASPAEMGCNAQLSTDAEVPGTAADLTVYDVIFCVSQAHRMHCTYTEEQTRELMRIPITMPQNGISNSMAETMEFQKIWLWQQYSARITPGVQRIVEFAKRVPGFCDFTQDDQLILIKLGFFEVWLSQVARMINDSTLTFDDGAYLTRQQLEILYDSEFVNALINFANNVNAYGLSDTEIGLFSAMVLLASDRSGIMEHKVISRARERIAEALRVQIVRSRPGSAQALQLMPALEAKIPELRALGAKHFSHLDWLRMNWTKQRLPPLFAEIFDIPKPEDEL